MTKRKEKHDKKQCCKVNSLLCNSSAGTFVPLVVSIYFHHFVTRVYVPLVVSIHFHHVVT